MALRSEIRAGCVVCNAQVVAYRFVGRAAHEKNIGFLLEMMALARRQQPQLMLVIAGEGPALPSLRRQAIAKRLRSAVTDSETEVRLP